MKSEIFFSEKQRFTQLWLWIILLGINALLIFGLVQQLVFGKPLGDKPLPDAGLIIVAGLFLLFTFGFWSMRLETIIKADGIHVRFSPFQLTFKFYAWDDIEQVSVRQYQPIREYGGWGLRGFGKNQALNVSGNKGIQIVTRKGQRLLIGTNKAAEAAEVLKQIGHLTN